MADASKEEAIDDAPEAMLDGMRRLMKNFRSTPKKAARKEREKKARGLVDGRALKSKGRTEQLNVKVRPDIKQALADRVGSEDTTIAEFVERTLEAALGLRGN